MHFGFYEKDVFFFWSCCYVYRKIEKSLLDTKKFLFTYKIYKMLFVGFELHGC